MCVCEEWIDVKVKHYSFVNFLPFKDLLKRVSVEERKCLCVKCVCVERENTNMCGGQRVCVLMLKWNIVLLLSFYH